MRKYLVISIFLGIWSWGTAQTQMDYIRKYQDIAVSEMVRSGIPASIKLAQAILESSCGQSDLACKANNHFGIKCGGAWNGKSFHKEDDDFEEGKLVKSCFREFNSVMECYLAHSDFLTDPAKTVRYGSLFQLDVTDYKSWAKGLSKAGYATDPQYANRLIDIIEKYELYRFDNEYEGEMASAVKPNSPPASSGSNQVRFNNNVKYALALKGDNPQIVARRHDVSVQQLLRYNEEIFSKDEELVAGTKIYLQPKRNKYIGKEKSHLLKQNEDIASVSQKYGIRLDALLKRNGLQGNEIPLPGQRIMLKGKLKKELRTADPYKLPTNPKPSIPKSNAASDEVVSNSNADPMMSSKPDTVYSGKSAAAKITSVEASHTVAKGETLYGIARNFGLSVEELKKRNNLSADTIMVGQKLIVR